jgi:hypothetical protein
MDRDRLRSLLTELRRELGSANQLNAESRALVEKVLADLDRQDLAARQERHGTDNGDLRDLVLKLESEHPRLAAAIGQVADALGRIGI